MADYWRTADSARPPHGPHRRLLLSSLVALLLAGIASGSAVLAATALCDATCHRSSALTLQLPLALLDLVAGFAAVTSSMSGHLRRTFVCILVTLSLFAAWVLVLSAST